MSGSNCKDWLRNLKGVLSSKNLDCLRSENTDRDFEEFKEHTFRRYVGLAHD